MAVRLAGTYSQTSIQQKYTLIGPRRKEAGSVWRWPEVWVIDCDGFVDVRERRWCRCWREDGEAKPVSLVGTVVGVLTYNHGTDFV